MLIYVHMLKLGNSCGLEILLILCKLSKGKTFFFSVYPDFNNIANFGNSYPVTLMKRVKNSFWKDCLDAFRYFSPYFTTLIF